MNNEQKTAELNIKWAFCIIDELIQNGIDMFCISPGSRSTPLTVAASKHPKANIKMILDERSSAFYALGYAKATAKPAVLICTSGSAVANYLPAIIDADNDQLPLIVITADRPPELRNIGANQTIDQVKIFSDYVKYSVDIPCPTEEISITTLLSIVDQCINFSKYPISGPVHLNCMYRKPLICNLDEIDKVISSYQYVNNGKHVQTIYKQAGDNVNSCLIPNIIDKINSSCNCLIIVGELQNINDVKAVRQLLNTLNLSVITDILSGLRMNFDILNCFDYYDLALDTKTVNYFNSVDLVIHIGGRIVSDNLMKLLSSIKNLDYVQISNKHICIDPERIVRLKLNIDIATFCEKFLTEFTSKNLRKVTSQSYDFNQRDLNKIIDVHVAQNDQITEISLPRLVSQFINTDCALFIGNSMPIRDMNNFADRTQKYSLESHIAGKRGTSGIDGTISTAIGFAHGLNKDLTLILGDISFLHDMNSLTLIKNSSVKLIIIVINNDGGGIFSFLPIADCHECLNDYFAVNHGYSFEQLARMFDLCYYNPILNSEFSDIYKKCLNNKKNTLIEVKTDRKMNVLTHKKINSLMRDCIYE